MSGMVFCVLMNSCDFYMKFFAFDNLLYLCGLWCRVLSGYVFRHKKVAKIFGGFAESA